MELDPYLLLTDPDPQTLVESKENAGDRDKVKSDQKKEPKISLSGPFS